MRIRTRCEVCGKRGLCEIVQLIWGGCKVFCCAMCAGDYAAKGMSVR